MQANRFDVVVIGAGAAGLTAAIGLAKAGFLVAVVEAAPFPGAENWSGCVYFCENLAHPDILAPDGVDALAWERRLVERGFFTSDGHALLGMTYRDPNAFRHCYTVLRPVYDHHLAQVAIRHGVILLSSTTAESLIREDGRIIGVCTNRGAVYSRLVFLAEGDASHLISREGYERFANAKQQPKFLQGIKQILEFPPGVLENRFQLDGEQGAAYEILLRNGTLHGQHVHLNMGGFVYTNRQSLSIGLVLPADNLHDHFAGDPNLLMEWFLNLPAMRHWFADGEPGVFGAKIIRGGGAKEIPTLIDDGLAIGGAASGIGIDFPYPNFTGPATAMGLLITQAAKRIRDEGEDFSRASLKRHYLAPLQKTHYWHDVEFLRRWPGYVEKTPTFFGRNIDLILQSTWLWTRSNQGFFRRWQKWLRLLLGIARSGEWRVLRADAKQLVRALRLTEVLPRPGFWRLLLDGTVNTLRDLCRRPRANLPESGDLQLHYVIAGGSEPAGLPPALLRGWFRRLAPVLASAAKLVYANDGTPLAQKLPHAANLLVRQVNLLDLIGAAIAGTVTTVGSVVGLVWKRRRPTAACGLASSLSTETSSYETAAYAAGDMTPFTDATPQWEARLAQLGYETTDASHIHVLWPKVLADKDALAAAGLWHVCPAHVYEARQNAMGQMQVVVNFENCIKCETCWRVSDLVDWGRDGKHRFLYDIDTPVTARLVDEISRDARRHTAQPDTPACWSGNGHYTDESRPTTIGLTENAWAELLRLCEQVEQKTTEFELALAQEPRTMDYNRTEFLQMLARYTQHLLARMLTIVRNSDGDTALGKHLLRLTTEAVRKAESRARHVWHQKFSWAAADGRHIQFHHLTSIRQCLHLLRSQPTVRGEAKNNNWLHAENIDEKTRQRLQPWQEFLDSFASGIWRVLEGQGLTDEQNRRLWELLATIPPLDAEDLANTLHPPARKLLLAELGRRDPSLAYRVANHLWARDLLSLHANSAVKGWACFGIVDESGKRAEFVPSQHADSLVLLHDDRLHVMDLNSAGIEQQPLATMGLRGAGLTTIAITTALTNDTATPVAGQEVERQWHILSAADLISIAYGMTDILCKRTIEHATTRVQFPGLFHDEEARDTLGKFGAIKKMVAEMAANRYVLETLDHNLSPHDFAPTTERLTSLMKALAAEILGTALGSVTYNAGQVFGGTGYSEDDLLSKYYRDAAAWRFLGPDNLTSYTMHGLEMTMHGDELTQSFSRLAEENTSFEELRQRGALGAELEEIHLHQERICQRYQEWRGQFGASTEEELHAELEESLGRQDAFLLASKAILLRTHCRLEHGLYSEIETALLRVWLEGATGTLGDFDNLVARHRLLPGAREDRPVVDPAAGPPLVDYDALMAAPLSYNSGDFLIRAVEPTEPRYVIEMVETDAKLSQCQQEIRAALTEQFADPREGLNYERYLEKHHRPDHGDLQFLRDQGFFRFPIPTEFGGGGRGKAEYYLLTANAHRLADVAISLTIQVNSSLGTTPILLACFKDLPKALEKTPDDEELQRRQQACELYLRLIASGQISAFALTEPSAGSDTARVATRATLQSVRVENDDDGVLHFVPASGKEPRFLVDVDRLEFRDDLGVSYRWSDIAEPSPIHYEDYDYETDTPAKSLWYDHAGRRVAFSDMAQLRERDGQLWYDYWELTGAKMWITNGRMCGVLCLYAKTDKGVTGFLVDRHAEGLIVGKDEAKMGQLGSPTNELALQQVRVPRENVLGLEGRGQVNALETLNVGRAGIAMSAMTQLAPIITACREDIQRRGLEETPSLEWRLQQMEEQRFIAEAVAFDVIGRFEHKQTTSVRLESAIAKMLTSELLHQAMETAEEIHGLLGQTAVHLIEKRKRDNRVLNIYEGTNEIQRFFVLKDLAGDVAKRWAAGGLASVTGGYVGRETLDLENLKSAVHKIAESALAMFGQQLWQNPNLQANCFLLSEAVAWLAAADSTLGRLAWLSRREMIDQHSTPSPQVELGRRAFYRCTIEARGRLKRFESELAHLRRGFYAPEVRAAALLFHHTQDADAAPVTNRIERPLSILVVIEPPISGTASPVIRKQRLQSPYVVLRAADRAALETALRLREAADADVRIEMVAVGPSTTVRLLRECMGWACDRVRLLTTPARHTPAPDQMAAVLGTFLTREEPKPQAAEAENRFDLILGGHGDGQSEEGQLAAFLAEALQIPIAGAADRISVQTEATRSTLVLSGAQGNHTRGLPACVTMTNATLLRPFSIDGFLQGTAQPLEILEWPSDIDVTPAVLLPHTEAAAAAAAERQAAPSLLQPLDAGRFVLETMGLQSKSTVTKPRLAPVAIEDVDTPSLTNTETAVMAILASDDDGQLSPTADVTIRTARLLAFAHGQLENAKPAVALVVFVSPKEDLQQQTLAVLREQYSEPILAIPIDITLPDEMQSRLLVECWNKLAAHVQAVVGEPWTEPALRSLAAQSQFSERLFTRVVEVDRSREQLVVTTTRLQDKIRCEYRLPSASAVWLSLREDAVVGAVPDVATRTKPPIERWLPPLDRFYSRHDIQQLLEELRRETGIANLSDAEFIIDVGFGVANRDGYDAVIAPLEQTLHELGVRDVMIGGSRKVTEELHLLPADRQIGQSGVSVHPKILLAIGISGAPQHLNYIGPRTNIVAFNRDPEAPLLTLNRRQAYPRVFPVLGDLFETVPAFMAGLQPRPDALLQEVPREDITMP